MKTIGIKMTVIALALGVAVVALAGTAGATLVTAEIYVSDGAAVGQPSEVQAMLRTVDDGLPVEGATVTFLADASFAGVSSEIEIGQAVTDENGVATLIYEHRIASEHQMWIEYLPPGETEPVVFARSMAVADGDVQLHRSTAGVDIPGLSVWLIIAVVSTVWAILLSVALRVIAIARAGGGADMVPEHAARPGHDGGRLGSESDPWAAR